MRTSRDLEELIPLEITATAGASLSIPDKANNDISRPKKQKPTPLVVTTTVELRSQRTVKGLFGRLFKNVL